MEQLEKLSDELKENLAVAVASSFIYNQEITAVEAQKGPVLKEYIESLGYTMDEVMVLGDSLNDYSMISMDFGATVAMENAVPEIKRAAKYITKNNIPVYEAEWNEKFRFTKNTDKERKSRWKK